MATTGAAPGGRRERLKRVAGLVSMVASLAAAWSLSDRVRAVDLLTLFAGGAVFGTTGVMLVRSWRERAARAKVESPDGEV